MVFFLQNLFNGIMLGGLYALIAIGYTMVYGILRLINFAHGDVMMMGVYFAFYAATLLSLNPLFSAIVAILGAALLGFLIDRVAYKPLRNAPRISALITAIGVSFFLESLAVVVFGAIPKSFLKVFKDRTILNKVLTVAGARIPLLTFLVIFITVVILIVLSFIVYRTKIGMAMRAISMDIPTTALMGVNVDAVIGFTFALGSALAAASGIMWAMRFPNVHPYMGFMPGLKAFIAAVFGGIGSIPGAVLGGVLLGLIEIFLAAYFPAFMGYRDAFAFIILIVILLVKPSGLLGKKIVEKV
ncbi:MULTISPECIES: branched-chain amino acid ABC transporter permease [unclassified Thermotoga]|uniref:branched-chain amino acid ABC transporter permease n=1 Tax=unclassified Thermotoga TaxID=2631113 RepID=UPI000540FB87|nr:MULTISPECIES: branched-chain amino acid ABC transporter permease [unclassified Thermotoga]AIY88912.1 inner-membrane translocator [Thermotoga sp. Cell2]KHC93078.1 inner-membrane translocator [Thermotoga sp. TBGT1765]KHC94486.1 inner-membrane translocator [Thermotoga sp. TBGT1766]KHC95573.1 inner-membrane translocator [Thermotoga sp. Xyl54]